MPVASSALAPRASRAAAVVGIFMTDAGRRGVAPLVSCRVSPVFASQTPTDARTVFDTFPATADATRPDANGAAGGCAAFGGSWALTGTGGATGAAGSAWAPQAARASSPIRAWFRIIRDIVHLGGDVVQTDGNTPPDSTYIDRDGP